MITSVYLIFHFCLPVESIACLKNYGNMKLCLTIRSKSADKFDLSLKRGNSDNRHFCFVEHAELSLFSCSLKFLRFFFLIPISSGLFEPTVSETQHPHLPRWSSKPRKAGRANRLKFDNFCKPSAGRSGTC